MAQVDQYVYLVRTVYVMIAVTSVWTYSQAENSHQGEYKVQALSQPYFSQFLQVNKLYQQKQYLDSSNIQEELNKVSDTFYGLSAAYSQQIQQKHPTNLLYNNDASNTVNLQDVFISALKNVAADAASTSACTNDTGLFIAGIFERQPWAVQFLDAFGKPGPGLTLLRLNFVGDYSLCRSASNFSADGSRRIRGNYCTLSVEPSGLDILTLQLGTCLPDSCNVTENMLFMSEVIQLLRLNGTLHVKSGECHTDDREMTTATVVAIVVLIIIGVLVVLGTSYDIVFVQWPKWRASSVKEDRFFTNHLMPQIPSYNASADQNNEPPIETTSLLGKSGKARFVNPGSSNNGVCAQILVAFSMYTNGSKVLNTSQPPGSLSAIHGIRFLSMSWVILGHIYVFSLSFVGNLTSAFPILLERWTFDAIANAFVSVDTFFTLSGLLTAYLTLTEIKKKGWKINWPLFYFHRFWRLTPPYMLTLLVILGLQQYMGSGALWPSTQPADKTQCENYWWTNLLYVNNLVETRNMCFGHSWYLANDMQFFLLSPLMIVPFFFNVYIGVAVCVGFLLINWITTGVLSYQHGWPTTAISERGGTGFVNINTLSWFEDYYIKPWCRIGAYVVGVLAGCLLAVNNGKIKMKWYTACFGWIIAVASGVVVVYGLRGDIHGNHVNSVSVAAFYNAMARSVWAACVSWVILACVSGRGGFVNSILSWSPFVMLGRLTYMAYLIHPYVIYVYFQNQEQLFYITDTSVIVLFCGIVVLTNMISFVLMLMFESPWISLERVLIRKKPKE